MPSRSGPAQPAANAQYGHSDRLTLSYSTDDGTGSGLNAASVAPNMDSQNAQQFCNSLICLNSGQPIFLESMSLGTHSFSVAATDNVNNAATRTVMFTIVVTFASLGQDVTNLQALGCIDNLGQSLTAKISAAQSAYSKGQIQTAINILAATIHEVQAQAGKHISTICHDPNGRPFDAVQFLLGDIQYLQTSIAGQLKAAPINGSVLTSSNLPISGATVNLVTSGKTVAATAATDSAGFYYFADVSGLAYRSTYTVSVSVPKGFKSSPASVSFTWSGNPVLGNFALY